MTVQLFVFMWFRTAFCRPEGATGEVFEPVQEGGITQGPSDGVGAAQRIGQDLVLVRRDERGKVRIARAPGPCRSRGRRGRAPAVHARSTIANP